MRKSGATRIRGGSVVRGQREQEQREPEGEREKGGSGGGPEIPGISPSMQGKPEFVRERQRPLGRICPAARRETERSSPPLRETSTVPATAARRG